MPINDLATILPELLLVLVGALLALADSLAPSLRPRFALLAAVAVAGATVLRWAIPLPGRVWGGVLLVDPMARFVDSYILAALFLCALLAEPYLARTGARFGEFYALLLWAGVGAMVMAKSDNLLVIFVGLELLSISLYALNAFHTGNVLSLEAGWKYLVVGGFSAAVLLFGVALLYGATGTLSLASTPAPSAPLASGGSLLLTGLGLVFAGLAFKLALAPFHAWAPDVYQGSPTPVTAFLSVVPKGAALVVLARLVAALLPLAALPRWTGLLAAVAVLSMTLGNLVAIAQRDLKRMLAYSGIAHMGYALVGLVAFGQDGVAAVLVYLAAYTLMNIAAFAVVSAFSEGEEEPHLITDLAGQGWVRPGLSFALAVAMFSLAGIPPTVGFAAKFLVFRAAVLNDLVWLAVVGVLNSLVSVFFYVRVVYYLYMRPLPKRQPQFSEPVLVRLVAGLCAVGIFLLGLLPGIVLAGAEVAARTLPR
ncbi:MAG: NADH-quinone oxidoreductase subunit N [Thermoanaerobaculaceae bacterium]|nr:NADH-quinone oxidoreductase subunit N [Thermoanaerobaculaceae bacterium]